MRHIDVAGFEEKFRVDIDPWNYRNSDFERYKRRLLIRACGAAKRGRGLELGCANGETTKLLASLCLHLTALDGSPTAIKEARQRNSGGSRIKFVRAILPDQMPRGPFDLVVASEIAYYLTPHALQKLGQRLVRALASRGRIVVLHHRRLFDDAAQHSAIAHHVLCTQLRKSMNSVVHASYPYFDIAAFEKGSATRTLSGRHF